MLTNVKLGIPPSNGLRQYILRRTWDTLTPRKMENKSRTKLSSSRGKGQNVGKERWVRCTKLKLLLSSLRKDYTRTTDELWARPSTKPLLSSFPTEGQYQTKRRFVRPGVRLWKRSTSLRNKPQSNIHFGWTCTLLIVPYPLISLPTASILALLAASTVTSSA